MSKKRGKHHIQAYANRDRELRKRDRQFGEPNFEIDLEGPSAHFSLENPSSNLHEPLIREASILISQTQEKTPDGTLKHIPQNPLGPEGK